MANERDGRDTGGVRDHTGLTRSLVADPALGPLRGLLLLLTVVTGVVDAVSILALGRVFVANMTGNVVFAAFAVVGAPGFSLSASLFALAGFLVGAYGGGVLISQARPRPGPAAARGRAPSNWPSPPSRSPWRPRAATPARPTAPSASRAASSARR